MCLVCYVKLTKNDIRNDHEWAIALIIVTANDARNAINLNKIVYDLKFLKSTCELGFATTFHKVQYISKLRCPFSKQKQKQNKITTKTSLKSKTKQIKTHKDTANQNQAFAIFFVFVLICCDFVLINGHLSFDMYCTR